MLTGVHCYGITAHKVWQQRNHVLYCSVERLAIVTVNKVQGIYLQLKQCKIEVTNALDLDDRPQSGNRHK